VINNEKKSFDLIGGVIRAFCFDSLGGVIVPSLRALFMRQPRKLSLLINSFSGNHRIAINLSKYFQLDSGF
jgi:hypothetical protein